MSIAWLTPWSRVLLVKPIVPALAEKYPAFYAFGKLITVLSKVRHLTPSWARLLHSTRSYHIFLRASVILFSHVRLGLQSGQFPSDFFTKNLCAFFLTHKCHLLRLSDPDWFDRPSIWRGVKIKKLLIMYFSPAFCSMTGYVIIHVFF